MFNFADTILYLVGVPDKFMTTSALRIGHYLFQLADLVRFRYFMVGLRDCDITVSP